VRAVDASCYRSIVLLDLVLPCSLLSNRQELLEVLILHLLVAPLRRVVVFVRYCSSKAWHDVVMGALRAHHGSVDDAYLNGWLRLLLQTEAAVELDVRHVGRELCCSELAVGVVGFDCCVLTVEVSWRGAVVRVRLDSLAGTKTVFLQLSDTTLRCIHH
jgi:hypothetical protein